MTMLERGPPAPLVSSEFVVTGRSLGTKEPRTLRVRAADERAAGWAAIERGVEVLSIEPVNGRPPPVPVVPPAAEAPASPPKPPLLRRAHGGALLAILLTGAALVGVAAPPLPRDLAEARKVNDWYQRSYAASVPRGRIEDVQPWVREQLTRMSNTRATFVMPVVLEGLTVAMGLVCFGVPCYEFLHRMCSRPQESARADD
jgi:hypothetical protein